MSGPLLVTHGPRQGLRVALTFDEDMTPGMRAELVSGKVKSFDNVAVRDFLEARHLPATFFMTGLWAQVYPASARAIADNPLFEVENHSEDHLAFAEPCYGLPPSAGAAPELAQAQQAIEAVTGRVPRYFRFPGGCGTADQLALVRRAGLTPVGWDVVGGDAGERDPARIVQRVLAGVRGGSIVVLHASGGHAPATAEALPGILAGLQARGLRLVRLQDLLSASR